MRPLHREIGVDDGGERPTRPSLFFPLQSVLCGGSLYSHLGYHRTVAMPEPSYLKMRSGTYYYSRKYPRHLQEHLGKFFRKSLKTQSLTEARKRRDKTHREFYEAVETAERELRQHPMEKLADDIRKLRAHADDSPEGAAYDGGWDILTDWLEKYEQAKPELTGRVLKIANAPATSPVLDDLLRDYERSLKKTLTNSGAYARTRVIHDWIEHCGGGGVPVHACMDEDHAWSFVREHIIETELSDKTKQRRLSALRQFFDDWIIPNRHVKTNPFGRLKISTVRGRSGKNSKSIDKVRPWTDAELQTMLQQLKDVHDTTKHPRTRENASNAINAFLLAIYSGMRIEELCSLQVEHCRDGVFAVPGTKTPNAVRRVPIHSAIQPLVDRLIGDRETGPLLPGLAHGGYDQKASQNLGKAISRWKKAFGFPDDLVFHNTRKSFTTKLEQANASGRDIDRLLGHSTGKLAGDVYSAGQTIEQMRRAIERVKYPLHIHSPKRWAKDRRLWTSEQRGSVK